MNSFEESNHQLPAYHLPTAEIYSDLTPEQQAEAEYFLLRYFEVVNDIFEAKYKLTSSDLNAKV